MGNRCQQQNEDTILYGALKFSTDLPIRGVKEKHMTANIHLMSSETKQRLVFLSYNLKRLFPSEQAAVRGMLTWAQTRGKPFTYKQIRYIKIIHDKVLRGQYIRD